MPIYDISRPIAEGMPIWPGDPEVVLESVASHEAGDAYSVSRLCLGSHTGTHVDAPAHAFAGGDTVDILPLDALLGPCTVVQLPEREMVTAEALEAAAIPDGCERLLIRSQSGDRPDAKGPAVADVAHATLGEDAALWLVARRVRLVGIDGPSVESPDGSGSVHRLLLANRIVVVEWLDLHEVPVGEYMLLCLPLRITDGDGAPARVVLIDCQSRCAY
jgi:arylformamidase